MRKPVLIVVLLGMAIMLVRPDLVSAHGKDSHSGHMDEQMKKLHSMMPMFSIASAELKTALEKGDSATALIQADKIKAATPDLIKSKPHKNIKQRKKFVELATSFEEAVTSTVDLAKKGDFAGAKAAFKNAEKACAACHAQFRN